MNKSTYLYGLKPLRIFLVSLLLVGVVSLTGCKKEEEVVSDLGMDIVEDQTMGELTQMTMSETTIPTVPPVIITTISEDTEVTTNESVTTSVTSESIEETSSVESSMLNTSVTTVTTAYNITTTSETTYADIDLPFLDVTAGTTMVITEEPVEEEQTGVLRSLKQTLNVQTNKGKAYWYTQLTEKEAEAYKDLLSAVLMYEPNVTFDTALTTEEYNRVFALLYGQNPQLFWMSGKTVLDKTGEMAMLFYLYDQKTAEGMQATLDKRVEELIDMMNDNMGDLEKLLLCHNYIVKYNSYSKDTKHSSNAYGCLIDGKSQCAGYAKGFQYLCDQLGIPCIYVNGINAATGNTHAWNQVMIDGEWYNIDCMWDDPEMTPEDKKNVSYRYMGVPSKAILGITHLNANMSTTAEPFEYFELPDCTAYSANADIQRGVYATTYEEIYEKLKQGCFDAVEEGRYCAHVKVENYDVYVDALERLFSEKEIYNIRKDINAVYGKNFIAGFSAAPENTLNYIEITLKYGEGNEP